MIHVPKAGSTFGKVFIASDVSATAEFCPADSSYSCFLPYFAVPKPFDGSVRKWTLGDKTWGNRTFELVKENVSIKILGRRLDGLFVIQAPPLGKYDPPANGWRFLFSPLLGLIAFSNESETAWLVGESGFGASQPGAASYPDHLRKDDLCPASDSPAGRKLRKLLDNR